MFLYNHNLFKVTWFERLFLDYNSSSLFFFSILLLFSIFTFSLISLKVIFYIEFLSVNSKFLNANFTSFINKNLLNSPMNTLELN